MSFSIFGKIRKQPRNPKKYIDENGDSQKELVRNIKDILLELEDNNLQITSHTRGDITISNGGEPFYYTDVKDTIIRLVDYMKNRLIKIEITYRKGLFLKYSSNSTSKLVIQNKEHHSFISKISSNWALLILRNLT